MIIERKGADVYDFLLQNDHLHRHRVGFSSISEHPSVEIRLCGQAIHSQWYFIHQAATLCPKRNVHQISRPWFCHGVHWRESIIPFWCRLICGFCDVLSVSFSCLLEYIYPESISTGDQLRIGLLLIFLKRKSNIIYYMSRITAALVRSVSSSRARTSKHAEENAVCPWVLESQSRSAWKLEVRISLSPSFSSIFACAQPGIRCHDRRSLPRD